MKKGRLVLLFITLLFFSGFFYAEGEDKEYPPTGMEIIKIGDNQILVPKGTQIRKKGDMNVIEDISEYSSRKFTKIEEQFKSIEAEYNKLANETKENFKQVQIKQGEIEKSLIQIKKDVLEIKEGIDKKNSDTN